MLITEKIFDAQSGEETIIEREETAKEIAHREAKLIEAQAKLAEAQAKATAKAALLERLGITQDEANLLLS
jgi:hypothetical protein